MDYKSVRDRLNHRSIILMLGIIAVTLLIGLLRQVSIVAIPLVLAFFLTVLMRPLHYWLSRKLPRGLRWSSLLITMFVVIAVFALAISLVGMSIRLVAADIPQYVEQLREQWTDFARWARQRGLPVQQDIIASEGFRQAVITVTATVVRSAYAGLAPLVLAFFLTILMLLEVRSWRDKSKVALARDQNIAASHTIQVIAGKIRRYLLVRTFVSAVSGVTEGIWLWLMGVPFPYLWGLLFFLLNFLPYIGSITATVPPVLLALLVGGWTWALIVLGGIIVLEHLISYLLDPRLEGKTLQISPSILLLSVVFWGWMWGIIGAIIGVPLTVTIIIICAHVESLRPAALLLSRSPQEGLKMTENNSTE